MIKTLFASIRQSFRLRRPYAAIVILMATIAAAWVMATNEALLAQKVAFGFASVLIGGFGAKGSIAVAGGALKVAVLLMASILTMFLTAVHFMAPEAFTASVLENTGQIVGGAVVVVVGDLLNRQTTDS